MLAKFLVLKGLPGSENIADLWRRHYSDLFNFVKSDDFSIGNVLLVPEIKDKSGEISSIENSRTIALASVMSKVLEIILLD